jgi:hypothetical protein
MRAGKQIEELSPAKVEGLLEAGRHRVKVIRAS